MALPRATNWPVSTTLVALISFACFGLVALATLSRLSRRDARWMTTLGALTYPLYLVHEKIGFFVIHTVRGDLAPWMAFGIATCAALTLAALLHYAVERPFGGRLRSAMLRTFTGTVAGARSAPVGVTPSRQIPVPHAAASRTHAKAANENVRHPVRDVLVPIPSVARD
jgi:peptidoglycan/LPS O-acetylase OafA/YrhL